MAATLLSINNYYYPRGGAEVVFFRHNGMLNDAGFRVVPFAMNHRLNVGGSERSEVPSELEYGGESDSLVAKIRKGLKAVYSFEARRKLARLIDRSAPDVCHAHNVYHHLSPSILGVVRARGIPLVMTLHDLKIACPAYSMLSHDGVCAAAIRATSTGSSCRAGSTCRSSSSGVSRQSGSNTCRTSCRRSHSRRATRRERDSCISGAWRARRESRR